MKNLFIVCFFTAMFVLPVFGQQGGDDVFSPATANPKAKALMKEDFFWSPVDESGPFGSDAGSDAAHGFYRWRKDNTSSSPMVYLTDLIKYWKYPAIAWDEVDTARLKAYMGLSMGMGLTYLVRLDESIIGVAFAQIVMEGRVDPRLKYYVQKALEREMLPMITRNFGNADQQKAHDGKIGKMLFVVNHMQ